MWATLHPVIRIICFIILSLFLVFGSVYQLAFVILLLLFLYLLTGKDSFQTAWPMLNRMRWFFLSILIIYAWLTPGQSIDVGWWMPTVEGAIAGGQRLLALVLMVMAVHWLLWVTPQPQLVSALYWLLTPLSWFAFPRERFAVRVSLILATITQMQTRVGQKIKEREIARSNIKAYAAIAADLVSEVIDQGEQEPCQTLEIDVADKPTGSQWLWPILLLGMLLLVDVSWF